MTTAWPDNCIYGEYQFPDRTTYADFSNTKVAERDAWRVANPTRWRAVGADDPLHIDVAAPIVPDAEPAHPKTEYTADKKAENKSRYSERKLALIAHADAYDKLGLCPIKIKPKSKKGPTGWAVQHLTGETAGAFFDTDDNIGVRLGEPSHGVVDLDMDWPETAAAGDVIFGSLPAFGRPGKPRSHRLVTCEAIKSLKFKLPPSCKDDSRFPGDGEHAMMICEIRSTGAQTVFPNSIHENGEQIAWDNGKIPEAIPTTDPATLTKRMAAVALTALTMRCNPGHGDHYYAMIPFAGALLRIVPDVGLVERLVGVVCNAWGTKWPASQVQVATMKDKLDAGDVEMTGLPTLLKHLGLPDDVAKTINGWCGNVGPKNSKMWPGGVGEQSGRPVNSYPNAKALLTNLNLTIYFDQFRQDEFITKLVEAWLDGRVTDRAVNHIRDLGSKMFGLYPDKEMMREAITAVATENRCNPVVEYLDKQVWDGVDRFANAPSKYLGSPDTPLAVASYRKMYGASVARIYDPGKKWDHRVTLSGAQGIMKSTHCEDIAIFPDLYTDASEVGLSMKEQMEVSIGRQIIEQPELAHSARLMAKDKASLSRKRDSARLAYGHYRTDLPRSSITIATVNPGGYLGDATGERRTLHIDVTKYDRGAFLADKDQLYAQAVHLYKTNAEKLYLDTDELQAAQAELTGTLKVENEFVTMLENVHGEKFDNEERISNPEIWKALGLLKIDVLRMHATGTKIAEAMMTLGWRKLGPTHYANGKHRGFTRPWIEPDRPAPQGARQGALCDDQGVPF